MKFIQLEIYPINSGAEANDLLRSWQLQYPKRRIINLSIAPNDMNYFLTIAYEVDI